MWTMSDDETPTPSKAVNFATNFEKADGTAVLPKVGYQREVEKLMALEIGNLSLEDVDGKMDLLMGASVIRECDPGSLDGLVSPPQPQPGCQNPPDKDWVKGGDWTTVRALNRALPHSITRSLLGGPKLVLGEWKKSIQPQVVQTRGTILYSGPKAVIVGIDPITVDLVIMAYSYQPKTTAREKLTSDKPEGCELRTLVSGGQAGQRTVFFSDVLVEGNLAFLKKMLAFTTGDRKYTAKEFSAMAAGTRYQDYDLFGREAHAVVQAIEKGQPFIPTVPHLASPTPSYGARDPDVGRLYTLNECPRFPLLAGWTRGAKGHISGWNHFPMLLPLVSLWAQVPPILLKELKKLAKEQKRDAFHENLSLMGFAWYFDLVDNSAWYVEPSTSKNFVPPKVSLEEFLTYLGPYFRETTELRLSEFVHPFRFVRAWADADLERSGEFKVATDVLELEEVESVVKGITMLPGTKFMGPGRLPFFPQMLGDSPVPVPFEDIGQFGPTKFVLGLLMMGSRRQYGLPPGRPLDQVEILVKYPQRMAGKQIILAGRYRERKTDPSNYVPTIVFGRGPVPGPIWANLSSKNYLAGGSPSVEPERQAEEIVEETPEPSGPEEQTADVPIDKGKAPMQPYNLSETSETVTPPPQNELGGILHGVPVDDDIEREIRKAEACGVRRADIGEPLSARELEIGRAENDMEVNRPANQQRGRRVSFAPLPDKSERTNPLAATAAPRTPLPAGDPFSGPASSAASLFGNVPGASSRSQSACNPFFGGSPPYESLFGPTSLDQSGDTESVAASIRTSSSANSQGPLVQASDVSFSAGSSQSMGTSQTGSPSIRRRDKRKAETSGSGSLRASSTDSKKQRTSSGATPTDTKKQGTSSGTSSIDQGKRESPLDAGGKRRKESATGQPGPTPPPNVLPVEVEGASGSLQRTTDLTMGRAAANWTAHLSVVIEEHALAEVNRALATGKKLGIIPKGVPVVIGGPDGMRFKGFPGGQKLDAMTPDEVKAIAAKTRGIFFQPPGDPAPPPEDATVQLGDLTYLLEKLEPCMGTLSFEGFKDLTTTLQGFRETTTKGGKVKMSVLRWEVMRTVALREAYLSAMREVIDVGRPFRALGPLKGYTFEQLLAVLLGLEPKTKREDVIWKGALRSFVEDRDDDLADACAKVVKAFNRFNNMEITQDVYLKLIEPHLEEARRGIFHTSRQVTDFINEAGKRIVPGFTWEVMVRAALELVKKEPDLVFGKK